MGSLCWALVTWNAEGGGPGEKSQKAPNFTPVAIVGFNWIAQYIIKQFA